MPKTVEKQVTHLSLKSKQHNCAQMLALKHTIMVKVDEYVLSDLSWLNSSGFLPPAHRCDYSLCVFVRVFVCMLCCGARTCVYE